MNRNPRIILISFFFLYMRQSIAVLSRFKIFLDHSCLIIIIFQCEKFLISQHYQSIFICIFKCRISLVRIPSTFCKHPGQCVLRFGSSSIQVHLEKFHLMNSFLLWKYLFIPLKTFKACKKLPIISKTLVKHESLCPDARTLQCGDTYQSIDRSRRALSNRNFRNFHIWSYRA